MATLVVVILTVIAIAILYVAARWIYSQVVQPRQRIHLLEAQLSTKSEETKALATEVRSLRQGSQLHPASDAVTPIRGQEQLQRAFVDLRSRPGLQRVQAIWSGDYGAIEDYFEAESTWLTQNPTVVVERLAVEKPNQRPLLERLAEEHENLKLYRCDAKNLEFELYLCEYSHQGRSVLAGVLVVLDAYQQTPDFGVLIDGQEDATLNAFVYSLRSWFVTLPRTPILGRRQRHNVWTKNAERYDELVSSTAPVPFLSEFIKQEEAILESLIVRSTGMVSLVEFGSGTGRTFQSLGRRNDILGRIKYFIGFDDAEGMVVRSQQKRTDAPKTLIPTMYFFSLDGAQAQRHFWKGQLELGEALNDSNHLKRHPLSTDDYALSGRLICSLLNTVGVLERASRAEFVSNMFLAATSADQVVLSVFDGAAFQDYAPDLYRYLAPLVGDSTDISDEAFNYELCDFRAGDYYSHWFTAGEVERLVLDAGGVVQDIRPIRLEGVTIGQAYVAQRLPK